MCEDNQHVYQRMINGDMPSKKLMNDELITLNVMEQNTPSSIFLFCLFFFLVHVYNVYKCYPVIVAEQIIDNNQGQNLKKMISINEKLPTSSIDKQRILSIGQQGETSPVVSSVTKQTQNSKVKFGRNKPNRRSNSMLSK